MTKPAILQLNLRREFFAQIAAGTKRTEYRRRLEGRHYDVIQFHNACPACVPAGIAK